MINIQTLDISLTNYKKELDNTKSQWDNQKTTISSLGNNLFSSKQSSAERTVKKHFSHEHHALLKNVKTIDKKSKSIEKELNNSRINLTKISKFSAKKLKQNKRDLRKAESLTKKIQLSSRNIKSNIDAQNAKISEVHKKAIKLQHTSEKLIEILGKIKREKSTCGKQAGTFRHYARNYTKNLNKNPLLHAELDKLKFKEKELSALEKKLSLRQTFDTFLKSEGNLSDDPSFIEIQNKFDSVKQEIAQSKEKIDALFREANTSGQLRSPTFLERLLCRKITPYTPSMTSAERSAHIQQQINEKKEQLNHFEEELGGSREELNEKILANRNEYNRLNDTLLSYIDNGNNIKKSLDTSFLPKLKELNIILGDSYIKRDFKDQPEVLESPLVQQWLIPGFKFALRCNNHRIGEELSPDPELTKMLNYARAIAPADEQLQQDIKHHFNTTIELANKGLIVAKYTKIASEINALEAELNPN